jgi:hypothetical protein
VTTQKCIVRDDVNEITDKMFHADAIVFATPVYFYEMCGQMKTLLDRSHPLVRSDYSFREIYLLATAGDSDPACMDGTISGLQSWVNCFVKTKISGIVRGVDALDIGDICNNPTALNEAYKMGKSV